MTRVDASIDRVVELRQYTLHPHRRDELIALFERVFVVPQDAVGARIRGCFRDLDDPDRFVWLRAFDSMAARHAALTAFYGGPVWRDHREAAVATMRDSDNVLLLRPVGCATSIAPDTVASVAHARTGPCLALLYDLRSVDADAFAAHFSSVALPMLASHGARDSTVLVTESAINTFERLPVRTGERVLVSLSRFDDVDALDDCLAAMGRSSALRDAASDRLLPAFMRRPEILRLLPTEDSRSG